MKVFGFHTPKSSVTYSEGTFQVSAAGLSRDEFLALLRQASAFANRAFPPDEVDEPA